MTGRPERPVGLLLLVLDVDLREGKADRVEWPVVGVARLREIADQHIVARRRPPRPAGAPAAGRCAAPPEDFLHGPRADRLVEEPLSLVPNHELRQRLVVRDGAWQLDEATLTMTEGFGFRGGLDVATAQVLQHLDGKHSVREAVDEASAELGFGDDDRLALAEASGPMARRLFQLGFLVRGGSAPPVPDRQLAGTEGFEPSPF